MKKIYVQFLAQYLRLKMLVMMMIMKRVMVVYAALWRYKDDQDGFSPQGGSWSNVEKHIIRNN